MKKETKTEIRNCILVTISIAIFIGMVISLMLRDDKPQRSGAIQYVETRWFIATDEAEIKASHESVGLSNKEVDVCVYSENKPYMDYNMITDTTSNQYQYIQDHMTVHEDGLLRDKDNYIGVALGSVYGPIGSKYRITTDVGNTFYVVKIDEKSDKHTTNGCQDESGAIIEMVIDIDKASVYYSNTIVMGNFDYEEQFNGTIVKIEKE